MLFLGVYLLLRTTLAGIIVLGILALTNCGFHLEFEIIQFMTSAVRCIPPFHALSELHALTGSDNTSFCSCTGNKPAYATWSTMPELTSTLCHMMYKPETPSSDDIAVTESFVIPLYSASCTLTDFNQGRQQIFAQSYHTFEYLQPKKAVSIKHVKRTTHHAGYVRDQSNHRQARICVGKPKHLGWVKSETGGVPF